MEQDVRNEIDRLHGRFSDLKERVVTLEAQVPHTNASLVRIEKSVDKLNGHIVKAIWLILAMFIGIVFNFAVKGGFHTI